MSNPSEPLNFDPATLHDSLEPDPAFELEIAALMVESLNLDVTADEIAATDPLYDGPLGLDSIDILEIALAVSKKYEIQLRADDADNHKIFVSLRTLANYLRLQLQRG